MTEQPQPPDNTPNLEPPMKSAAPPESKFSGSKFSDSAPGKSSDRRSSSTVNPKIDPRINDTLQSILAWIIRTTIQLRPTALATLRLVTAQTNRWIQQLETQERTARDRNEPIVKPIDWTPVTQLTSRIWTTIRPIWEKTIAIVKPRLPESFQSLSDRTLSGIFAGTLLLVLWFFSVLPSGQAATPERNTRPAIDRSAYNKPYGNEPDNDRNISGSSPTDRPSEAPAYRASNRPKRSYDSTSLPIVDRSISTPSASPNQTIPQTEIAPSTPPKPVSQNPVSQPSEIQNPESSRRLQLRKNLDIIADSLVNQAIVSIRPSGRNLTITLSDAWYQSTEDTQTKLTNSLLVTTQGQGYSNLRLEDTEGSLIARNPVVGEGMIILQRAR
ncbi:MAG: hypothetical protein NT070_06375 [Cyanobacteria bacterium]|nr:hypothetical protein [Cyanobacteriota bacterium]